MVLQCFALLCFVTAIKCLARYMHLALNHISRAGEEVSPIRKGWGINTRSPASKVVKQEIWSQLVCCGRNSTIFSCHSIFQGALKETTIKKALISAFKRDFRHLLGSSPLGRTPFPNSSWLSTIKPIKRLTRRLKKIMPDISVNQN